MKNKLLNFLTSVLIIFPISVISCTNFTLNSTTDSSNSINSSQFLKLEYKNYFNDELWTNEKVNKEENKIKQQITKLVKKYRINEWNNYYEKNKPNSKVFNINFLDYSNQYVDKDIIKKGILSNNDDIEWTKNYKNQNDQFRYFNDFLNLIQEENEKNQKDILLLRYEFFSIKAAQLYREKHNIGGFNKSVYEIDISDWSTAIIEAVALKTDKLTNILKAFFKYYGFDIDVNKVIDFIFKNKKNKLIDEKNNKKIMSIPLAQTYLSAKDLLMRYSSKSKLDANKNPIWKPKAERANEIIKVFKEKYFNVFLNSLIGKITIPGQNPDNPDSNTSIDEIQGFINKFKDLFNMLIETFYSLVSINLNEYCTVKDK